MVRVLFAVLALALPVVALGQANGADWSYEGGAVPIAYVDNAAAQFQFACRGGDLAMGFWVRAPHRQVAGATVLSLALDIDRAKGARVDAGGGSRFAQDMPLIQSDGASMIIRGPVARQWAGLAQRAKSSIALAFVRSSAKGTLDMFDAQRFGAGGSSAAIGRVLDQCG